MKLQLLNRPHWMRELFMLFCILVLASMLTGVQLSWPEPPPALILIGKVYRAAVAAASVGNTASFQVPDHQREDQNKNIEVIQPLKAPPSMTLEDAYFRRLQHVDVNALPSLPQPENLRTRFLPNENYKNYPALEMEQVCMNANGSLVLVNMSEEELQYNVTHIPELNDLWTRLYAKCGNQSDERCAGVVLMGKNETLRMKVKWVAGDTLHFIPYVGNAMHEFAERVWQHLARRYLPNKSGVGRVNNRPIETLVVHWWRRWMREAEKTEMADRRELLWQARLLVAAIAPEARLLVRDAQEWKKLNELAAGIYGYGNGGHDDENAQEDMVCFERLLLQAHNRDRIDETRLPPEVYSPALQHYRRTIFSFFSMAVPQVQIPPSPLRTLVYLRNDTQRRRVVNAGEVLKVLRNISNPKLHIYSLDEMLSKGEMHYEMTKIVSMLSQMDIFVITHGANAWNALFLPENALVVEIFGPCNWSHFNYTDLTILHTWIHPIVHAIHLKHDVSNPFGEPIPNPHKGNSTSCIDAIWSVPDFTVDVNKLGKIFQKLSSF